MQTNMGIYNSRIKLQKKQKTPFANLQTRALYNVV